MSETRFKEGDKVRVLQNLSYYETPIATSLPYIVAEKIEIDDEEFAGIMYFVYPEYLKGLDDLNMHMLLVKDIELWHNESLEERFAPVMEEIKSLADFDLADFDLNFKFVPRDPQRIPVILEIVKTVWTRYPDLRFGQLIDNIHFSGKYKYIDLFMVEDDKFLEVIQEFEKKNNN